MWDAMKDNCFRELLSFPLLSIFSMEQLCTGIDWWMEIPVIKSCLCIYPELVFWKKYFILLSKGISVSNETVEDSMLSTVDCILHYRAAHNELEKTRRANLRGYLDNLKDIVPSSSDNARNTTLSLLTRARDYILVSSSLFPSHCCAMIKW